MIKKIAMDLSGWLPRLITIATITIAIIRFEERRVEGRRYLLLDELFQPIYGTIPPKGNPN